MPSWSIFGSHHKNCDLLLLVIFYIPCSVNPRLINPKWLFNWEGTIETYQIMTIGGVPPLINKQWFINPVLTCIAKNWRINTIAIQSLGIRFCRIPSDRGFPHRWVGRNPGKPGWYPDGHSWLVDADSFMVIIGNHRFWSIPIFHETI
jgi:hypothetical protein